MVNKIDWIRYAKSMKSKGMVPMSFKQYKYSHSGTSASRANTPGHIRMKKLRKLGKKRR